MNRAHFDPDGGGNAFESPTTPAGRRAGGEARPVPRSRRILGMRVDATSYGETADAVLEMGCSGSGGMVCVANTHMVMEAFDAPEFRRVVSSAERVTPDGVPLV